MNQNRLFTIVVFVLLGAGLGASGWLVVNPIEPWPSFEVLEKLGTDA
jgi:hypothetical protein